MDSKLRRTVKMAGLFELASDPDRIAWEPFRPGVSIFRLYGDGVTGPSAALIRFEPGGEVPCHEHSGFEHILVLAGSQLDEHGLAGPGALMINPPGTRHCITSKNGCVVLAIYEKPVKFLEAIPGAA